MIGQQNLYKELSELIETDKFPRFSIFHGIDGDEKLELAQEIGKKYFKDTVEVEPKIDAVREMISTSYHVVQKTLFIIKDSSTMSGAAKNALLKITEEPPGMCFFILLTNDLQTVLGTIKSRAVTFKMDAYSKDCLIEYARTSSKDKLLVADEEFVRDVCDTPADVIKILGYGISDFRQFMDNVEYNIHRVTLSNAFKLASYVNLKDSPEKYDLNLFWKAYISICRRHQQDAKSDKEMTAYVNQIKITSDYLNQLNSRSVYKSAKFDLWIIDITEDLLYNKYVQGDSK